MKRTARAAGLGCLVTALLAGCSVSRTFRDDTYTVQRGDTLSEIAQAYNIDWRALAQWNHIHAPYNLRVGQTIYLKPFPPIDYARFNESEQSSGAAPTASQPASADTTTTGYGRTTPLPDRQGPTVTANAPVSTPTQAVPSPEPAPASGAGESTTRADAGDAAGANDDEVGAPSVHPSGAADTRAEEARITAASKATSAGQATVKAGGPAEDGWQWPASGELLRGYDPDDRHRGIEIGGAVGSPIYAASSGTVAYNGTGLKGYGQLVIIKHDEHYLSAYGFVDKSLVHEGDTVTAGAHIADMGLGPGNKPMLHFEIRRDGDPVDPETLLPSH